MLSDLWTLKTKFAFSFVSKNGAFVYGFHYLYENINEVLFGHNYPSKPLINFNDNSFKMFSMTTFSMWLKLTYLFYCFIKAQSKCL